MPKILLVDNYYAQGKVAGLRDSLSTSGAEVTVIGSAEAKPHRFDQYDGVVLSGSPAMLSESGRADGFRDELRAIRETKCPLLGVCFGHQLIGIAYGSKVIRAPKPTRRYVETEVLVRDELFAGISKRMKVYESHSELVESLPDGFMLTARSPTSPIAAFRHRRLPVVGLQFHPEKNSDMRPDGRVVVANFVKSLQ